ncbi:dephospho-CoA kinase [Oceanimonas doudoroffii]|uniref:Dephospho-CoA kinase n=1 Tax=Oceanimonas doudoroffii TaxID=84158 RepID=A0A233RJM9_9GAMM|nr:dephospho-CoA kinase [Oceanimonas doudoroffii]OXY83594.1 dephospho-CoA kinase [Oceanimonas doudoroffii]
MSYVVGLTGGIGSGKSTVAELFAKQGVDIVDADIIAREVVAPGEPALAAIEQHFGSEVITASGELDRRALRARVFDNAQEKDWLNALLHPVIRGRMVTACAAGTSSYCLLVVPLLVENNLTGLCNRVLVVDVSPETQLARTVKRDNADEAQIRAIMAAQASREQRLAAADDVLNNNSPDQAGLHAEVARLHREYLALAKDENGETWKEKREV